METFKNTILNNWHAMRWLRLLMGAMILSAACEQKDVTIGLLSGVLIVQAVFNLGCGVQGCAVPPARNKMRTETVDAEYEEIK